MNSVARLRTRLDGSVAGCVLSECGTYRYALWRIWDMSGPLWMMVLLNPSTATEEDDDPTVVRCVRRATRARAGGLVIVNTAAIRETDARKACAAVDPVGPDNEAWVRGLIPTCSLHIAGWGPNATRFGGDQFLRRVFAEMDVPLYALSVNKDGSPRHPLYLPYDLDLTPYS